MNRVVKLTLCSVCVVALTACAASHSKKMNALAGVAESGGEAGTRDPISSAAFWGTRYDRNPANPEAAVGYSKALRNMGSNSEALEVMGRSARTNPDDAAVNLEYGKALIANDRAFEAIRPIQQAIVQSKSHDWRAYSAYGVALDKIGEHKEAREQYDIALKLEPKSHEVLNNKGLSFALSGKLDDAELTLRSAAASPSGTPVVRQNLALVLGFKGDTDEAERLARSDLPPRIANNNVSYFRSLVSQPAYWSRLEIDNYDVPAEQIWEEIEKSQRRAVQQQRARQQRQKQQAPSVIQQQPAQPPQPSAPLQQLQPVPEQTPAENTLPQVMSDAQQSRTAPAPTGNAVSAPVQPQLASAPAREKPTPPSRTVSTPQPQGTQSIAQSKSADDAAIAAFKYNSWSTVNGPTATGKPVPLENTNKRKPSSGTEIFVVPPKRDDGV